MKNLIIGKGEVGTALRDVFKNWHKTFIRDIEEIPMIDDIAILHICYPDHKEFVRTTKYYIDMYQPLLTIIHSSVKVGTTDLCGNHVVYSPVRGRHPKLAQEIHIFEKFIFGRSKNDVELAEDFFNECGLTTSSYKDPCAGELLKVVSNVHMGLEIAWRQEVHRMFQALKLDEKTYDGWERSYNDGCHEVGDRDLARPIMNANPIGGHCILPCVEILKGQFSSPLFDFILKSNLQTIKGK